VLLILI
jgi:hypothetical protein